jgi:hypothetical protein
VGRRPTLLGGLVGTIGSIIWFGLSPNFTHVRVSQAAIPPDFVFHMFT